MFIPMFMIDDPANDLLVRWLYAASMFLFGIYWSTNMVTHSLFVMQYWVLSKKIKFLLKS